MADDAMVVDVVTPERELVSKAATALVLRSSDGDLTVLPGHTPIVTDVVPGLVRVDAAEGEPVRLAVHGGYLQVITGLAPASDDGSEAPLDPEGPGTRVRLLAGSAELAEDIDTERAERARSEAAARVEELRVAAGRGGTEEAGAPSEADPELVEAEAALRRAEVRLQVARGDATTPS